MGSSIEQLAKSYAKRLRESRNRMLEADRIVSEIKGLTYDKDGKELSKEDKQRFVILIEHYLNGKVAGQDTLYYTLLEKSDNSNFLQLITYINTQLNGRK